MTYPKPGLLSAVKEDPNKLAGLSPYFEPISAPYFFAPSGFIKLVYLFTD